MRTLYMVLGLGLALLGAAGCSDSGADPLPVDAGPQPVDQCLGASDLAIVTLHNYADAGADGGLDDIGTIGRNCAKETCLAVILDDGDIDMCMTDCYESSTAAGLTTGCRSCYIDAVYCGQANCVIECLQSVPSVCTACLEDHCFPRMNDCTGI